MNFFERHPELLHLLAFALAAVAFIGISLFIVSQA